MKTKSNIVEFAGGEQNLTPYVMFLDYWNHYSAINGNKKSEYQSVKEDGTAITFSEKEDKMNAALRKEIVRRSGVAYAAESSIEQWFNHPLVVHETFAVISAMVDMILPDTIIETIGLYTDVRTIGWGDSAAFNVEPRDLFVVSKHGHGQRTAEIHKQFKGQVTVLPEMHELSVQVSLYKVLSGSESLANFVAKVVQSMETQMTLDAYGTFATAMAAVSNTATTGLRVAGYSQSSLVRLCQQVTAWNGGNKAVIIGTQLALLNVLPDDANYRYVLESDYVKLGYIKNFAGFDVMALPQVADMATPFGMALSDSYIWIVSPSSNKLVKLVLEGNTLSNTSAPFQNANLTQETTITKSWGSAIATNAVAGVITL